MILSVDWQGLGRPNAPLVSGMTEGQVANRTKEMDDPIMAVLCETCQAEITDEEAAFTVDGEVARRLDLARRAVLKVAEVGDSAQALVL